MMKLLALFLALSLFVISCGGDSDEPESNNPVISGEIIKMDKSKPVYFNVDGGRRLYISRSKINGNESERKVEYSMKYLGKYTWINGKVDVFEETSTDFSNPNEEPYKKLCFELGGRYYSSHEKYVSGDTILEYTSIYPMYLRDQNDIDAIDEGFEASDVIYNINNQSYEAIRLYKKVVDEEGTTIFNRIYIPGIGLVENLYDAKDFKVQSSMIEFELEKK